MLHKIAAVLAAVTAAVHFFVGGADALAPMLGAELPDECEGAMHACWHIVTSFLVWSVFVFLRGGETMIHFGLMWIVAAIVFFYVGIFQDGLNGLIVNPQWTILLVTGVVALFAELKARNHRPLAAATNSIGSD